MEHPKDFKEVETLLAKVAAIEAERDSLRKVIFDFVAGLVADDVERSVKATQEMTTLYFDAIVAKENNRD